VGRRGRRRQAGFTERVGVLLLVFDLWRRLPPKRRRQVLGLARKHGPRVARRVYESRRAKRKA
jgi:hypothetical protein